MSYADKIVGRIVGDNKSKSSKTIKRTKKCSNLDCKGNRAVDHIVDGKVKWESCPDCGMGINW